MKTQNCKLKVVRFFDRLLLSFMAAAFQLSPVEMCALFDMQDE